MTHFILCFYRRIVPARYWFYNIYIGYKINDTSHFFHVCCKYSLPFFTRETNFRCQLSRQNVENFTRRLRIQSSPWRASAATIAYGAPHHRNLQVFRTGNDNTACVPLKFLKGKYFLACEHRGDASHNCLWWMPVYIYIANAVCKDVMVHERNWLAWIARKIYRLLEQIIISDNIVLLLDSLIISHFKN